ncbi:TBC-domain-containing protein [Mollisia scopiformis]|uniref:TBC-domain-containing protein n=1 Tax=Mollisia scopiformis TaxID=149040 RepID=A0A194XRX0_MOLSC|nr:TBC-domain-containing protein [Mollisia scopiformis]KUJ23040.1 TBC-domain-containing protein [Mollisia scopiformis]
MEPDAASASLQRTASHHSNASGKSSRSQTVRVKPRKYASYMSSSASSISDKSLTSFPSFSPESPKDNPLIPRSVGESANGTRKTSDPASSIVESLLTSSPLQLNRTGLFDDAPLSTQHVPGSIHHANDDHIERLIARNGAVALVRQLAEDLAQRDAQMAALRRRTEERERALRKIVLECGLSNLDLETRLRAIEGERKVSVANANDVEVTTANAGLEDMMNDAMNENVVLSDLELMNNDATIRAAANLKALEDRPINTQKGWKDYIWGGTSRKSSRSSSINGDAVNGADVRIGGPVTARKSVLQNGVFQPPESTKRPSRGSSQHSGNTAGAYRERKPSGLATLALKLVAGSTLTGRDAESTTSNRGRANSTGTAPAHRAPSTASARTTMSARTVPVKPAPRAIPIGRRPTASAAANTTRAQQERWDTMGESPQKSGDGSSDNYGPVEMDQILPLEAQPPTITQIYNNPYNQDFLTDRFGFIYDQRRKKRQREAAEKIQKTKRGRVEMLSSGRSGVSVDDSEIMEDSRPDTPTSLEGDEGKPAKRWQDYLKIATFPTELLSHTPSGAVPAFEVMEGGEVPRSPGITSEERGFLPSASTVPIQPAVTVTSEDALISKPLATQTPPSELPQEDTEPVKLLLKQLGEVHDSLQREKTVRWNDFLRKVRAERRRDGEAAKAALAADTRSQKPITVMPEATLTDGEMIGVAGLGNKGKVGRAKWKEFKTLVLGGIPVAYRAKIWAECSGAATLRIPGYYDDLIARSEADDDPSIVAQIEMDINRTLTDNIFFRKGPGVGKLNEVLLAYSRRNIEVGYCQGMNLITACLLLIMPTAEDAFWVLTSIIENILPRGYYDHSLLASRADQQVLRQYVSEILPKLSAHLDDLSIELEALTFQWFLSVFTDCLSAEALFRVWDVVFCTNDGSTFLFEVALALLKLNESQLLQCSTPAGIYTYINHQMTNHAISIDGLIHASEGLRKVVKRDEVETRRTKAIEAEKDLIKQREARNAARRAERIAAASAALEVQHEESEASSPASEELSVVEAELTTREPLPIEEEEAILEMD